MKKSVVLAFIMLAVSGLYAQQGFIIGLQGGPQNCWITNQNDKDANVEDFKFELTGGYAGMFKFGYNFGPPLGFHTGVVYSFQGQRNSFLDTLSGNTQIFRRSLTYLKIPFLLHISSNPNAPATIVFEAGPQLSLLQKAEHTVDQATANSAVDPNLLYEQSLLELTWGLGADIRMSDYVCFSIMHRGDYSLFDVEDKTAEVAPGDKYYPFDRLDAHNLNLSLMVGFTFNFNIRAINKYDKRLYWRHGRRRG